jgi:hypothetical protein
VTAETTFDLETLSVLAARTGARLKWAGLLLAAMLVILLIDLQLKRSVARLAVDAAERCARADAICARTGALVAELKREAAGGRLAGGEAGGGSSDPGGDRPDVLAGDAPVAAGPGPAGDPLQAAVGRHPAGRRQRKTGDDPGTGRGGRA